MRSLFDKKLWVLLVAILALGALTVLSVGLRDIAFDDAQPIGRQDATPFVGSQDTVAPKLPSVSLRSQIILLVAFVLLAVLVGLLLSPKARRKMIRLIIRIGFTCWAIYFLLHRYPDMLSFLNLDFSQMLSNPGSEDLANIPPPVFTPPQETSLLSYTVGILIVLVAMFLAWKLYLLWREFNSSANKKSLSEIAHIARTSLHDLSSGRNSTDVIMNCYFRMGDVVADRKNMQRGSSVTPAEFARRLEQSGLPGDAVRNLTHLFEGVRYGARKAGPKEINEAVACLTTILQYCGEPV